MDFYKLDKIDKIVISLIFIIVAFISFFNTFSFASTNIPSYVLPKYGIVSNKIQPLDDYNLKYWSLVKGVDYVIINNTSNYTRAVYLSSSLETGSSAVNLGVVQANSSLKINLNSYNYEKYFVSIPYKNDASSFVSNIILQSDSSFFNLVSGQLASSLGPSEFWSVFNTSVPYILVVVVSGFGFYLIFHNIKEISKGREKMN